MLASDDDSNKVIETFLLFGGCWVLKDKRRQKMSLGRSWGLDFKIVEVIEGWKGT